MEVVKLSVEGLTNQSIAEKISDKFETEVTDLNIGQFLKRNKNKTMNIIKEDKKFQGKLVEQYFDTMKQLQTLNSELWKFFYELRKNPEYKDKIIVCKHCSKKMTLNIQSYGLLLKTAEQILKQIAHVDAVLGKLKQKSFNIQYNYVDLSKKISFILPQLLNDMEKRGIVKVNKKRLKVYQGGKKMEYDEDDKEKEGERIMVKEKQHLCELTPIPMEKWGKDHWSTLAYLETLAVDKGGWAIPVNARMRTNEIRHPHLTGHHFANQSGSKYPTRLKEGEVKEHDDWDCVDDATEEGLVEDVGTGMNRAYKFTKLGKEVMAKLRQFKMDGGNFKDFVFENKGLLKLKKETAQ